MPQSSRPHSTKQLQPAPLFRQVSRPSSFLIKMTFTIGAFVLVFAAVAAGWTLTQINNAQFTASSLQTPSPQEASRPTPQVASATDGPTFADLLAKQSDFSDWIAGLSQGSIWLVHPQSGQTRQITQAVDAWHGPIAELSWSPNRQLIATLILSETDARGMATNPTTHLKSLGLQNITSPANFPYGQLAIIDLARKQVTQTKIELKNTPKVFTWIDDNRLAMVSNAITIYQLNDGQTTTLVTAGSSDDHSQLASPLVWDSQRQQLYYLKRQQQPAGSLSIVSRLSLANKQAVELFVAATSQTNQDSQATTIQQAIDLALSPDYNRLGLINDQGLAYLDLQDMSMHQLDYSQDRLWMNQVALSNLAWINSSRLTYQVLYQDGQKAWSGWDILSQQTPVFAKGGRLADWSAQTGQLLVGLANQPKLAILTPNWDQPIDSQMTSLPLDWTAVSW